MIKKQILYSLFDETCHYNDEGKKVNSKNKGCPVIQKDLNYLPNGKTVSIQIPEGYILIDVDTRLEADRISFVLNENKSKYWEINTTKGRHFLFKLNDKIKQINDKQFTLLCGIKADIKAGNYNSKGELKLNHSFIRFNEIDREFKTFNYDLNDLDEVPNWLLPVNKKISYEIMTEGEGSSNLSSHRTWLQEFINSGFITFDEGKSIIKKIGTQLWEKPMELNTIEATILNSWDNRVIEKPTYQTKIEQADNLIKKYNCIYNIHTKELWVFIEKQLIWTSDPVVIKGILQEEGYIKEKDNNEMYHTILKRTSYINPKNKEFFLPKNNIIYCKSFALNTKTMEKIDLKSIWFPDKMNYDYKENLPKNIDVINYLKSISKNSNGEHNPEYFERRKQVLGYILARENISKVAIIEKGVADSGKSGYYTIIERLIKNYSTVSSKDLNSHFGPGRIKPWNLINIDKDCKGMLPPEDILKKFIGDGDTEVDVKNKGESGIITNKTVFIFLTNDDLKSDDKTDSMTKKLSFGSYDYEIPVNERNEGLLNDYMSDSNFMEYLLYLGVQYAHKLLKKEITLISNQKSLNEYNYNNTDILDFMHYDGEELFDNDKKDLISFVKQKLIDDINSGKQLKRSNAIGRRSDLYHIYTQIYKGKLGSDKFAKSIKDYFKLEEVWIDGIIYLQKKGGK